MDSDDESPCHITWKFQRQAEQPDRSVHSCDEKTASMSDLSIHRRAHIRLDHQPPPPIPLARERRRAKLTR